MAEKHLSRLDEHALRRAFGCFATGITVVTALSNHGRRLGITANSFSSVSLNPPLISVNLGRHLRSLAELLEAQAFAVNLLSSDQEHLSSRFARAHDDKWTGVEHNVAENGSPIIKGRLACFECSHYAQHIAGDHVILLGEVIRYEAEDAIEPLVYFRGGYRRLQSAGVRST
jgi:flavin reductase (DIM6/NTAB) family NADH-FMN oxidoreductase RutF